MSIPPRPGTDPQPIKVLVTEGPNSHTKRKGSIWTATCEVDGRRFEATTRNEPTCALARQLVAAGISDRPMIVTAPIGGYTWPSMHEAARTTYQESDKVPLKRIPFLEGHFPFLGLGKNRGQGPLPAPEAIPDDDHDF
jgi:hypothetical protein